jgi:hypothetical protein
MIVAKIVAFVHRLFTGFVSNSYKSYNHIIKQLVEIVYRVKGVYKKI